MSSYDLSSAGYDEEPQDYDEKQYDAVLKEARAEVYSDYMQANYPDLNQASFILDSIEAMSYAEFDRLSKELVRSFERGEDNENRSGNCYWLVGKIITKAVLGRLRNSLEVTAHNKTCDILNDERLTQ